MLLASRQSQSRIVVLRLLQQGQVPGQYFCESSLIEVSILNIIVNMRSNPNFHGIKRNTIFPTRMNRETPPDGLYQSGRVSFRRVHDQARRRPRFQILALVQALHLTQLTCKVFMDVIQPVRCVD